jgi:hypothetical protein
LARSEADVDGVECADVVLVGGFPGLEDEKKAALKNDDAFGLIVDE